MYPGIDKGRSEAEKNVHPCSRSLIVLLPGLRELIAGLNRIPLRCSTFGIGKGDRLVRS